MENKQKSLLFLVSSFSGKVIFITIIIVPGSTASEEGLINPGEKKGAEFKGIV